MYTLKIIFDLAGCGGGAQAIASGGVGAIARAVSVLDA